MTAPGDAAKTAAKHGAPAALALGALGVVFGDIGTSPLYALQAVFAADGGAVKPTTGDVYGVISLIVWAVTLIVSIKFVTFIMRADNQGEGGIMALVALVRRARLERPWVKSALVIAGLFGVALFYGDGMITPAVSVLSAVEGIEVAAPSLEHFVLPFTLVVLIGLFLIQRFGTGVIGRLFGPVMVVWFAVIAAAGTARVIHHPQILRALSPHYALAFFVDHPGIAFISLGSVVLAVTGAEALYADMGHFGRSPIRRGWFFVVFPALTLNYMGQGSLILDRPETISSPFYLLLPDWAQIPVVILATLATLIASQAVISGAFSVTRQAVQLGYLPRLNIRHTSEGEIGQVYVPAVNWALLVAVVALVLGFGSSAKLVTAYGIAVTGTLLIDSILFLVVLRVLWRKPLWMVVAGILGFVTVDLLFLAANVTKIGHGGWFPLLVGALVFLLLTTWDKGREEVTIARRRAEGPLPDFIARMRRRSPLIKQVQGVAVYLNQGKETTPLALRVGVDRIRAIHETIVIVSVETTTTPHVPQAERVSFDHLGDEQDDFSHITLRFGFQDRPDVPRTLMRARNAPGGLPVDFNPYHATYFLSSITIVPDRSPGMAFWRKLLFTAMARNAASPTEYFRLPAERVVTMGSQIVF
ncbi:potassium transporter Kup [Conexibacter sp. JD483]|uniref:potassium transporter Kup n=1 Tax=unclassified Conexibacter TaxID=2627773 RepID=UPI0027192A71|nr:MULTISPECIES: potassium transporter Kup [unclassified Conexibacter]MDO8186930.1 potassium transporter Kup [Conexibacter sp. CPCC 205706]MDO8200615.1 potassium transporter Kup [Conexibacter sp. CPCC 205762]MDR9368807.1 potassium transporter Kup [Conexibacter sp. JD483]